ncbi:hypothetical protein GCM10027342_35190 [Photobacterium alginatilyticum]
MTTAKIATATMRNKNIMELSSAYKRSLVYSGNGKLHPLSTQIIVYGFNIMKKALNFEGFWYQ